MSSTGSLMLVAVPLFVVLLLAYVLMWRGWAKRSRRHALPELVPAPAADDLPAATLQAGARYFATTVSGEWLDRVVARGLGARSTARLALSAEGLDIIRPGGSFRIPAHALRGARHDQGIAGKVVPPHGLLVVTWEHGSYFLDTGFRLTELSGAGAARAPSPPDRSVTEAHDVWVRMIADIAKEHTG